MCFLSPLFILTALFAQESAEFRNWLNQGGEAFRNAQYAVAIQAFQRAIDLNPSSLIAHLYLATAYMQQYIPGAESNENSQVAARAQEAFSQVLALDPANKVALASVASLYLNQKKWDDAQQWYEKLIALDPNNADAHYSLGYIAYQKWYPAYGTARAEMGLKQDDPGPFKDKKVKEQLKAQWLPVITHGLDELDTTLKIDPERDDAMAYKNLLIRERADLLDDKAAYEKDVKEADGLVQKALDTKKIKAERKEKK